MRFSLQALPSVPQRQPWMTGKHARPGLSHDAAHGVTFGRLVTMNRAFRTGCFPLAQWTVVQPRVSVIQQFTTIGTTRSPACMGAPTIKPNHGGDCSLVQTNIKRQTPERLIQHPRSLVYFLPMDAPHFGHVKDENRNPGLGGTAVLHFGQCPSPPPACLRPFNPGSETAPGASNVFPTLMVFCWFRPGMSSPLERRIKF